VSRFSDEYDDESWYPNAAALWSANVDRALRGKRGKKALREMREALLALPEHRLIAGALCTVKPEQRLERAVTEAHSDYGKKWIQEDWKQEVEPQGGGVCAIGAYLWFKKVKAGADPQAAFDELPTLLGSHDGGYMTAELGRDAGLTFTLAQMLVWRNDQRYEGMTPEERFEAFVAWIDEQLADPAVPA
jgi:hypothetical protein